MFINRDFWVQVRRMKPLGEGVDHEFISYRINSQFVRYPFGECLSVARICNRPTRFEHDLRFTQLA